MLLKTVAVAALCASGAVAQTIMTEPNCMTQGGMSFAFCTESLGTGIFWNYSPPNVEFVLEGPADGWRAVGFGSNAANMGPMVPANVVFGCIEVDNLMLTPMGVDFELTARNAGGIGVGAGNQNLMNFNHTLNADLCTIQFTRPIDIGIPEQTLGDRDQTVIVATGAQMIAIHDMRTAFTVNFANPAAGASTLSASMTLVPLIVGSILVALW